MATKVGGPRKATGINGGDQMREQQNAAAVRINRAKLPWQELREMSSFFRYSSRRSCVRQAFIWFVVGCASTSVAAAQSPTTSRQAASLPSAPRPSRLLAQNVKRRTATDKLTGWLALPEPAGSLADGTQEQSRHRVGTNRSGHRGPERLVGNGRRTAARDQLHGGGYAGRRSTGSSATAQFFLSWTVTVECGPDYFDSLLILRHQPRAGGIALLIYSVRARIPMDR